ncbi:peroxiredoxin-like family protein [Algibacter sp. 2305UL17-15]|uniref:peroxiredoxin-like family protein n=1 Tax=Algibacter sp. 2305UL17-15 TaxID=3231268 RepID=UPI00345B01A6
MVKPKTEVPDLKVALTNGTNWNLKSQKSRTFTLIVFYRGLHCPKCKQQLEALTKKLDGFIKRGVNLVAVSCDTEERAKKTIEKWDISELPVGYKFSIDEAKKWGLYISESISDKEPDQFSEPGLFLIRPDFTLYASSVQTMPFARPHWDDLLNAIDYIEKNDYPARGSA